MKYMTEIWDLVKNLSLDEQKALVSKIVNQMNATEMQHSSARLSCVAMVEKQSGTRPDCPHCRAKAQLGFILKAGFDKGVQRYRCKSCGKFFAATTNTAFARTRKGADVWEKFIHLTITGASIHKCAAECDIAYQTAFTWRHKVLNVFCTHLGNIELSGTVEMDEMFIPISYKGNRVKGCVGTRRTIDSEWKSPLPRKAYRRGSDNKSVSSKNRACVFCMVSNGNKGFYASVPGVGYMLPAMLDKTVSKHVNREKALLLVDNYKVTMNYLERNKYNFISLLSNTSDNVHDHKPEIRGKLHLQHVNAMHRHIRRFLAKYCGVSTKYLENYISLFVWLQTNKSLRQEKKVQKASISRASASDCYISWKELYDRPLVPVCA